ncbi:hypothetical protein HYN48_13780 [Flavobacterium magnum]|uniref:Uncharacterized protein n=1 Tax=Flavobacterium magnum TaxID=2162713 RepID=A0A2S0RHQ4_9FLAO|nr:hypothetical protein HYN48_13780 [Flavobacterium magnum]
MFKTEIDDRDIRGDAKSSFFYDPSYAGEIYRYEVKFTSAEVREIKKILNSLKMRPDLDEIELHEGPTMYALIIKRDTVFGYGGSVYWEKKAISVPKNPIAKKVMQLQ